MGDGVAVPTQRPDGLAHAGPFARKGVDGRVDGPRRRPPADRARYLIWRCGLSAFTMGLPACRTWQQGPGPAWMFMLMPRPARLVLALCIVAAPFGRVVLARGPS